MDEPQLTPRDKKLLDLATSGGKDSDLAIFEQINELEDKFDATVEEIKSSVPNLDKVLATIKGKDGQSIRGDKGDKGETGEQGPPGTPGKPGKDGKEGRDGRDGNDGRDGVDGRDGTDGQQGENGADGSSDTPDEIIEKINQSRLLISRERIEGLADAIRNMVANTSVAVTTSFFNGLRAKNMSIVGATATQQGDTVFITVPSSSGGGTWLTPTGTVDGINATFGVTTQPTMVMADSSGRVEGFGYTYSAPNITMDIAPKDFIRYQ